MGAINHEKWVGYYCYTHITVLFPFRVSVTMSFAGCDGRDSDYQHLIRILPCKGIESWIATQILGLLKNLVCGENLLIYGFCSCTDVITMINRESDINR